MTKSICAHCGYVSNTTYSPNEVDGLFFSEEEQDQVDSWAAAFWNGPRNPGIIGASQCRQCKMITPKDIQHRDWDKIIEKFWKDDEWLGELKE